MLAKGRLMADVELREYIAEIEGMLTDEDNDQVIAHCRHILGYFPKNLATYQLLGKALLEERRFDDAAAIFRRVLSATPYSFVAHIGMAIVGEEEGNLEQAIGYMERAFETRSHNAAVHSELKRLCGQRDGAEPSRIRLTEGALARLYLRGAHCSLAVDELRPALEEYPDRIDLQVMLAEALWKIGRRIEAVKVCQDILERLPFSLDANLILYAIWTGADGDEEATAHWKRVEALDPYLASEIQADTGPASSPDLHIPRLDYVPPTPDEVMGVPDWVRDLGLGLEDQEPVPGAQFVTEAFLPETEPFDSRLPGEDQELVPDWLREIALSEAETALTGEQDIDGDEAETGESTPDSLQDVVLSADDEGVEEPVGAFDTSADQLSARILTEEDEEGKEDLPEWLAEAVEWEQPEPDAAPDDEEGQEDNWLSEFDEDVSTETVPSGERPTELTSAAEPSDQLSDRPQEMQEDETPADESALLEQPDQPEASVEPADESPETLQDVEEAKAPAGAKQPPEETVEPVDPGEPIDQLPDDSQAT